LTPHRGAEGPCVEQKNRWPAPPHRIRQLQAIARTDYGRTFGARPSCVRRPGVLGGCCWCRHQWFCNGNSTEAHRKCMSSIHLPLRSLIGRIRVHSTSNDYLRGYAAAFLRRTDLDSYEPGVSWKRVLVHDGDDYHCGSRARYGLEQTGCLDPNHPPVTNGKITLFPRLIVTARWLCRRTMANSRYETWRRLRQLVLCYSIRFPVRLCGRLPWSCGGRATRPPCIVITVCSSSWHCMTA
jgi:hypothetical protein